MHKSFVIKAVGAILFMIATAIGLAQDFMGITRLPMNWWPLITFVAFCVLVIWMISGLYRERSRLLNSRPSIYVEPVREGETFYLKVHNDGEQGIFKAQIQLDAEDDPQVWTLKNYTGHWKNSNRGDLEIMKGHTGWIKIAELISHPNSSSVYLKIWFFDDKLYAANYISSSTHWIGATITSPDGSTKPMTKHEYKPQVRISATPSLREGVYQERFRLNVDRLEVDTNFQSTSHKASLKT